MSDSSSDIMELEETGLLAEPQLEAELRRLQAQERALLAHSLGAGAGCLDDIAALEHQDALRLNQVSPLPADKRCLKITYTKGKHVKSESIDKGLTNNCYYQFL